MKKILFILTFVLFLNITADGQQNKQNTSCSNGFLSIQTIYCFSVLFLAEGDLKKLSFLSYSSGTKLPAISTGDSEPEISLLESELLQFEILSQPKAYYIFDSSAFRMSHIIQDTPSEEIKIKIICLPVENTSKTDIIGLTCYIINDNINITNNDIRELKNRLIDTNYSLLQRSQQIIENATCFNEFIGKGSCNGDTTLLQCEEIIGETTIDTTNIDISILEELPPSFWWNVINEDWSNIFKISGALMEINRRGCIECAKTLSIGIVIIQIIIILGIIVFFIKNPKNFISLSFIKIFYAIINKNFNLNIQENEMVQKEEKIKEPSIGKQTGNKLSKEEKLERLKQIKNRMDN